MPRGNHYGPMGYGPMSGRRMGYCAGYNMPGCTAMEYGPYGPMHRERHFGGRGRGMHYAAFAVPYPEDKPEEKLDMLLTRQTWLESQLNEVRQDISDLEIQTQKSA